MRRTLAVLCCSLGFGCSAGAGSADRGSAGQATTGGSPSAGANSQAGAGGTPGAGAGGGVSSGAAGGGAGGVSASGAAGNDQGGAASGAAGAAGTAGTAGSGAACTPSAAGVAVAVGDTVHDAATCLDWMKTTEAGVNYAAAETFCGDSMLGGFDDWRIPSASELASIITLCGKYPPEGPIDTQLFDLQGDGYWTTTSAGEPNKVCAIGMLNAGGYYHYGTAGPQVVRCVRGAGTAPMVADCTTAQGCMTW